MGSLLLVLKAMFSNSLQVLLQVAVWLIVLVAIWPTLSGCSHLSSEKPTVDTPHFTLWQLPSQTPSQMMSYVLVTGGGKVIVIDGGNRGDALYLKGFLGAVGNHVHNWFISHPHPDHVDALTAILEEPGRSTRFTVHFPKSLGWPTPRWLWENDSGQRKGSGPWETLTVRDWMRQLKVSVNYVSAFGLQRLN